MLIDLATWLVNLVGLYLSLGLVFAVGFHIAGARRLDPLTDGASFGFRLLVTPGVIALWPLLGLRWVRGGGPPTERSPHRDAARNGGVA